MFEKTPLPPMTTSQKQDAGFKKLKPSTCCGVIEEATEAARQRRYNRTTPQPWIARKLVVGVTVGIVGYTGYVYISRLCLPMIRRERTAQADRSTGIALLVIFSVLYLWLLWAYIRVVMTPPGYAKDYIQKSERPLFPAATPLRESWPSSHPSEQPIPDIEANHRDSQQSRRPSLTMTTSRGHTSQRREPTVGLAGPSYEDLLKRDESRRSEAQDRNAGVLDAISVPKPAVISPTSASSTAVGSPPPQVSSFDNNRLKKSNPQAQVLPSTQKVKAQKREKKLEALNVSRRPPTTPVLDPVYRYCTVDQIVKPYRAHHCRLCGTCVLKYDHHCPWIGQCVGARNHKFFINFNQATVVFTAYVLGTLLAYTVKSSTNPSIDIDPQEIVVIALAGFFLLFTFLLLVSHVGLITRGMTTVESLHVHNMKERESKLLHKAFGWWQFSAKRRQKEEWDKEWGTLEREANIWWLGNTHEEWMSVMGHSWLGWFLPVGRSGNDGLSYPANPRFNPDGRWRRRTDWPAELQ